jgi:formiminotetrahydrofolate cyclodeaminase
MLASKTVTELLEAFASPTPTPGGGSAAALSGAVAASLFAMVAAMPKTKNGTQEDRLMLDAILDDLVRLRKTLTDLIDRDAASYDGVVAAYKLPKGTDEEKAARKRAVQDAMRVATDVPMETARASASLITLARVIAERGNPNAKSDTTVALSMAQVGMGGALANVEVNVDSVGDEAYAARLRDELEVMKTTLGMQLLPIMTALGWKGHIPPRS